MLNEDDFWAELDSLGEEAVREKYDRGLYGGKKKRSVKAWLGKKDRENAKRTQWRDTTPGRAVFVIATGLILAYLIYRLGWT